MNCSYTHSFLVDNFDRLAPNLSDVPIKGYKTLTREGVVIERKEEEMLVQDLDEPQYAFWVTKDNITFDTPEPEE